MSNPYESPRLEPTNSSEMSIHPDWKWMAGLIYAVCVFFMFGVIDKTNSPTSLVFGIGHGYIRGPAILGEMGFKILIPFLAMIPAALVCLPFRRLYRTSQPEPSNSKTLVNVMMLLAGLVVAVVNASLFRGD